MLWPDPAPLPDDLWIAYQRYYTHTAKAQPSAQGIVATLRRRIKHAYWTQRYNYGDTPKTFSDRFFASLLYLSPLHRREADADVRCLPATPAGRLLDLGCGAGEWMREMQARGWKVEGCDFDPNAVAAANDSGLQVRLGSVMDQGYPPERFDAVTLSHVIEHVPNARETLRECFRILKPGGTLVILTPNAASFSHRLFSANWRGLEVPRHLQVFTPAAMRSALVQVGFKDARTLPFAVTSVLYESTLLRWGYRDFHRGSPRVFSAKLVAHALKFLELFTISLIPSTADCLIAIARKPASSP